ncbi:hypothetical protein SAMN06295967_102239 [Belliella buryatensis]|uniref:Uncharacterized protein n=1 Tax=Belliella buryatensis TaxID=1500549 RepID=A0A239BA25_9BACT|nr:hypothetical protein [Belliella buryatensis]SNS04796.1 hypothetical protein SAMN06295967_102239 [Belliella buryatensis]
MASFIDDLLGKLFPKKSTSIKHKENFTQTEEAIADVTAWAQSTEGKNLLNLVKKNYHFKTSGMNASPEVHILKSPYANGFAVSFERPFDEKSFSKVFFAFGQRMLDLGYQKISLDRKFEEINEAVKMTEKQYFKPPLSNADFNEKIDQLFGNVSIEKISVNDKPSYLKVLVTVYSDSLYKDATPFEDFIDDLFEN